MSGHWYGEEGRELLKVHEYPGGSDMETVIEDIVLEQRAEYAEKSALEVENDFDERIKEALINEDYPEATWRELCDIWNSDNTYGLMSNKDISLLRPCGATVFELTDDLLVENTGLPIDATQPKVIRGSVRVYKAN